MAIAMNLKITKAEHSFVCRDGDGPVVAQGNSIAEAVGNFVLRYQELLGVTIEADESAQRAERVRRCTPA